MSVCLEFVNKQVSWTPVRHDKRHAPPHDNMYAPPRNKNAWVGSAAIGQKILNLLTGYRRMTSFKPSCLCAQVPLNMRSGGSLSQSARSGEDKNCLPPAGNQTTISRWYSPQTSGYAKTFRSDYWTKFVYWSTVPKVWRILSKLHCTLEWSSINQYYHVN
jgi:hypothetical protein